MISHDPRIAARQIAILIEGMSPELLFDPLDKLTEAIFKLLQVPKCPTCGKQIDLTKCRCGNPIEHSEMLGHLPVPDGCECVRMTPNRDLLKDPQGIGLHDE